MRGAWLFEEVDEPEEVEEPEQAEELWSRDLAVANEARSMESSCDDRAAAINRQMEFAVGNETARTKNREESARRPDEAGIACGREQNV